MHRLAWGFQPQILEKGLKILINRQIVETLELTK
jgi:hypothetical protein